MSSEHPAERLLKYPLTKRQDLNQSQLGSFKFTPVDNVQSMTAIATNILNQQLAQNLARTSPATFSQHTPNTSLPENTGSSHKPPGQRPTVDPNFFNKHIKPHLGDSRLRLGPAAFRSAVESATTSPPKAAKTDRLKVDPHEFDTALTLHHPSKSLDVSAFVKHFHCPIDL